ncbi:MAG: hypothetical protein OEY23_20710, partial [Acidimicrobiia bacterium]|nr:hypothetical protein [Acidimicrobiia bacterium]
MSNCPACHLAVPNVAGCCRTQLHILGEPIGVVPVAATGPGAACPGCGVAAGGLHHVSCPVAPCPLCVSPLAGCSCPFDERPPPAAGSVALPGAHGRRCQPYSLDDPPWQRELIESFPAACAPWRVRYRPLLRPLVRWAVERGRPVDLDMAALTFHVLEAQWRDWGVEMFLDRPDVTGILQYRAWGALATRGRASLPLDAAVHVWSVVAFLAESGRLSIDSD